MHFIEAQQPTTVQTENITENVYHNNILHYFKVLSDDAMHIYLKCIT